ncbi:MAG: hypothetical protein IJ797_05110 [Selenomonadaceae bacterium]|nr:hypothetical protein [Selenomonadaceae bacterium]
MLDTTKITILHEVTDEYSEMNEEEYGRLKSDILFNKKINTPLLAVENDGKLQIFDGCNHYNMLKEIHNDNKLTDQIEILQIPIEIHKGKLNSIKLITGSYNLSRRHLTSKNWNISHKEDKILRNIINHLEKEKHYVNEDVLDYKFEEKFSNGIIKRTTRKGFPTIRKKH